MAKVKLLFPVQQEEGMYCILLKSEKIRAFICSLSYLTLVMSDFNFTFHFHALEKEMATHANVLAWRIPRTVEPGGLLSMGSQSRTRLKRLSSNSSSIDHLLCASH